MDLISDQKGNLSIVIGIIILLSVAVGSFYVLNQRTDLQPSAFPNSTLPTNAPEFSQPPSSSVSLPPSSQEAVKPVSYQKTSVTTPSEFGFAESLDLNGIGVKAKFPQDVNLSLQQENFYVAKAGNYDTVTFELKNYDGGGRRAWFQKEYKYYKDYAFLAFNGKNHSGYIAYSKTPQNKYPGSYFYFTAASSSKMLVIHGTNDINGAGIFFGGNIEKFKSFLSTVELISAQNTVLESYPQGSDIYRWSDTRKTVWEDADLGLKITTPEWTESRYTRGRDANGKFTYTEWARVYPDAKVYDSTYFSESIRKVEVSGNYMGAQTLSILSAKYQGRPLSDVGSELLISAGFCASEWKNSKSECPGPDYCYTRDEVLQNLKVEKQIKIGSLDAQLRTLNQDFSYKNDCRPENIWLIKAQNGQFVLSSIYPDSESIRLEGLEN